MSISSDEGKRLDITEILREADYIESLLDAEKQLVQSARLVERILKTHFIRDGAGKGLRTLISYRRKRLSKSEFQNASFAIDIRNRTSHHTQQGRPTDEQMSSATKVFLQLVRGHAAIAEQRLAGGRPDPESVENARPDPPNDAINEPTTRPSASVPQDTPSYVDEVSNPDRPDLGVSDEKLWLSASSLAEHTFCPRAGLLTHEGRYSDPEVEFPSLGRMTWYEPERLEEAYVKACHRLFWMLVGLLVGVAVFVLTPLSAHSFGVLGFIGALGFWVYRFVIDFSDWVALGRQRIEWRLASASEPDPWSTAQQEVDWWELLQAGFEVEKPVASLKDNDWKLTGKPRRLLRKGDLVIPVHRVRRPQGPIEQQHIVRVMAHCHLVAAARAAVSPYAIILFANSSQGITVPSTLRANRDAFYEALRDTRATVLASDNRVREPLTPMPRTPCRGCPHGRPRSLDQQIPTMRYDDKLEPKILVDHRRQLWHSCCGDRFDDKAEHEKALPMRLIESEAI